MNKIRENIRDSFSDAVQYAVGPDYAAGRIMSRLISDGYRIVNADLGPAAQNAVDQITTYLDENDSMDIQLWVMLLAIRDRLKESLK